MYTNKKKHPSIGIYHQKYVRVTQCLSLLFVLMMWGGSDLVIRAKEFYRN